MTFEDMVKAQDQKYNRTPLVDRVLCFDPGHTTGYAVFENGALVDAGQIKTDDMENGPRVINDLMSAVAPVYVICEDYRVYKWRKDHHVGSEMLTTRVIGAIETIASFNFIPVLKNMAVVAKRFVTDDKLKAWDMWRPNEKHARDAIRHGCYFLLFHHQMLKTDSPKKSNNPHKVG